MVKFSNNFKSFVFFQKNSKYIVGSLSLFGTWKGKGRIYVNFPLSSLKNQRTYLDPWLAIFKNHWTGFDFWEMRTFF